MTSLARHWPRLRALRTIAPTGPCVVISDPMVLHGSRLLTEQYERKLTSVPRLRSGRHEAFLDFSPVAATSLCDCRRLFRCIKLLRQASGANPGLTAVLHKSATILVWPLATLA